MGLPLYWLKEMDMRRQVYNLLCLYSPTYYITLIYDYKLVWGYLIQVLVFTLVIRDTDICSDPTRQTNYSGDKLKTLPQWSRHFVTAEKEFGSLQFYNTIRIELSFVMQTPYWIYLSQSRVLLNLAENTSTVSTEHEHSSGIHASFLNLHRLHNPCGSEE